MSLKEQAKKKKSKALEKMGDIYKEFLQSYLAWLYLQNPRFDEFLTNEELTNYLFNEIYIPNNISLYINTDSLNILSKTYEYISRYKDKTSIFTISMNIHPKRNGPYKSKEVLKW